MGVPTVIPITSEQGWSTWPAQDDQENTMAVLDHFSKAGFSFHGQVTIQGATYWLFKKPVYE